jgi:hypothetical protein
VILLPQNCRNVLVRSNASAPGGATAKLADFGLSRAMKQHQTHRTTKTCGTMSHMVSSQWMPNRMPAKQFILTASP